MAKAIRPLTEDEKAILGNFHRTFDTDSGKAVLDWMSVECMEREGTFVVENFSATAFNEGKRAVIRKIRTLLEAKAD